MNLKRSFVQRGDFTLNQWLAMSQGSVEENLKFRLILCESADEVQQCIIDAFSHIISQLVINRQYRQQLDEDQITIQIVEAFGYMGLPARHDAMVGGHCDISISTRFGVLWLAEAKIWRGCAWAFKGFRQLLTRYATGLEGHLNGALLLYAFSPNASGLLVKWRGFLERRLKLGLDIDKIAGLHFHSRHRHPGSGLTVSVRHEIVPLFW